MTPYGLVASLAWALLGAFFVSKIDRLVRHVIAQRPAPAPRVDAYAIEIPEDLMAVAMGESDEWAQNDTQAAIRERYVEYGKDWNRVRKAFGLGALS